MAIPIEQIKKWRQLIAQGRLEQCLKEMLARLEELDGDAGDTLTLLSGQLADLRRRETLGTIDFSSANIQRNKVTHALLELLSGLEESETEPPVVRPPSPSPLPIHRGDRSSGRDETKDKSVPLFDPQKPYPTHAEPPTAEPPAFDTGSEPPAQPSDTRQGAILYQIPERMQVEEESRCVVRLAFDAATVRSGLEEAADITVKSIRVEREMSVALIDPNEPPAFSIRSPGYDEIQVVEADAYTEWVFRVKPLRAGSFPLMLKVSVVLFIDGRERHKNIVLEELIQVLTTPVTETGAVKSADALVDAGEPGLGLFISWSRSERDATFCQDLVKQLAPLRLQNMLHNWDVSMVPPGVDRDSAVRARLGQSELFAVLISPDYLADDGCFRQMEAIRRQQSARPGAVVPILIRSCNYDLLPIGQLQVLPRSLRAIAQHEDTDSAWAEVVREIHQLVKQWESA